MDTINSQVLGNVTVSKDTQYNYIDCDNIVIEEGVMARLFGKVNQTITIKKGAMVYLHGKMLGKIANEGGVLYVFLPNGQVESY